MNLRFPSSLVPRLTAGGLVVLVIILAFAFVAGVLIPGLELAGELADSTVALKFVGQHEMNAPRAANWFALSGDTSAKGEPIAGKHAAALRELWSKEQESLDPILKFKGVPYQDNESTGTALNESGRQLERDVAASSRVSKRLIPLID